MDPSVWNRALALVAAVIGHQDVDIWLREARPTWRADGGVRLVVRNQYYADWISENYLDALSGALRQVLGNSPAIDFECVDEATAELPLPQIDAVLPPGTPRSEGLNLKQTFETFVVGSGNRMAHAAASAVTERPTWCYNPLMLYGASGLGKTHLMHAIGNGILARHPSARVLYVGAETFTKEMVEALQTRQMDAFRSRYRQRCTVLLVDDIQFIAGKEYTQEEFFHTFNALVGAGAQIVLTSDVEPAAIARLEPRLRTRFQGGAVVDLQPPDRETLEAILRRTVAPWGVSLSRDLVDRITGCVDGNVRELQGVLNKLDIARRLYPEGDLDEVARQALDGLYRAPQAHLSVAYVIDAVARAHDLRAADLTGPRKHQKLTRPRHIAMYLARKYCGASFPELGRDFDRDHSTVQHGVHKVEDLLGSDPDLSTRLRVIEGTLQKALRANVA
jgi:chromosomal replication initiator protein